MLGRKLRSGIFETKELVPVPARLSFVLRVPLCNLRPSIINSVLCDRILQRAYCSYLDSFWHRGRGQLGDGLFGWPASRLTLEHKPRARNRASSPDSFPPDRFALRRSRVTQRWACSQDIFGKQRWRSSVKFAFHQCGLGSNLGPGVKVCWVCCQFSPLLRGLFSPVLRFFSLYKRQYSKFKFDLDAPKVYNEFITAPNDIYNYNSRGRDFGCYALLAERARTVQF